MTPLQKLLADQDGMKKEIEAVKKKKGSDTDKWGEYILGLNFSSHIDSGDATALLSNGSYTLDKGPLLHTNTHVSPDQAFNEKNVQDLLTRYSSDQITPLQKLLSDPKAMKLGIEKIAGTKESNADGWNKYTGALKTSGCITKETAKIIRGPNSQYMTNQVPFNQENAQSLVSKIAFANEFKGKDTIDASELVDKMAKYPGILKAQKTAPGRDQPFAIDKSSPLKSISTSPNGFRNALTDAVLEKVGTDTLEGKERKTFIKEHFPGLAYTPGRQQNQMIDACSDAITPKSISAAQERVQERSKSPEKTVAGITQEIEVIDVKKAKLTEEFKTATAELEKPPGDKLYEISQNQQTLIDRCVAAVKPTTPKTWTNFVENLEKDGLITKEALADIKNKSNPLQKGNIKFTPENVQTLVASYALEQCATDRGMNEKDTAGEKATALVELMEEKPGILKGAKTNTCGMNNISFADRNPSNSAIGSISTDPNTFRETLRDAALTSSGFDIDRMENKGKDALAKKHFPGLEHSEARSDNDMIDACSNAITPDSMSTARKAAQEQCPAKTAAKKIGKTMVKEGMNNQSEHTTQTAVTASPSLLSESNSEKGGRA